MEDLERKKIVRMCRLIEYIGIYKRILAGHLENGRYDEFENCEKELSSILKKYFNSISALKNQNMREIIKNELESAFENLDE